MLSSDHQSLFQALERRITMMGGTKTFSLQERKRLGLKGYKAELRLVEVQEARFRQLGMLWPDGIPFSIVRKKAYPLTEKTLSEIRDIAEHDQKWRAQFMSMKEKVHAEDHQELPDLPSIISPSDVTERILPYYQRVLAKNTFGRKVMDFMGDFVQFKVLKKIRKSKKAEKLMTLPRLSSFQAEFLAGLTGSNLELRSLKGLNATIARKLACFQGDRLQLGVLSVSPEAAKELASFEGRYMWLDGLNHVDIPLLEALSNYQGRISFDGCHHFFSNIDHPAMEMIKSLTKIKIYNLHFNGVRELERSSARRLSHLDAHRMHFNGLTLLEPSVARALSGFRGNELSFKGLVHLDAALAQTLGSMQCKQLDLSGITYLSIESAEYLSQFKGTTLLLDGVTKLDKSIANALSKFKGRLELKGINEIGNTVLRALMGEQSAISLDGLHEIEASQADILSRFTGRFLYMFGLRELDASSARALARLDGRFRSKGDIQALVDRYRSV